MWQIVSKKGCKGIKCDERAYHHGLVRYARNPKLWLVVILCRFYMNQFRSVPPKIEVLQDSLRMILMILESRTCTGLQYRSLLTLLHGGNSIVQDFLL